MKVSAKYHQVRSKISLYLFYELLLRVSYYFHVSSAIEWRNVLNSCIPYIQWTKLKSLHSNWTYTNCNSGIFLLIAQSNLFQPSTWWDCVESETFESIMTGLESQTNNTNKIWEIDLTGLSGPDGGNKFDFSFQHLSNK